MIHWPTAADGLVWCACDNRTFATAEEWQAHVVESVIASQYVIADPLSQMIYVAALDLMSRDQPVDEAGQQPHRAS